MKSILNDQAYIKCSEKYSCNGAEAQILLINYSIMDSQIWQSGQ